MYCTDTDLLRWEPMIAAEAAFASQTLLSAAATLAGSTLTIPAGSLVAAGVQAGDVVALSGAIAGCYPIVSVTDATTCVVSVLHNGLDALPPATVPIGSAGGLQAAIRTFGPQRKVVSNLLDHMAGVSASGGTLLNRDVLRRPCALGTLHMIYNAMATAALADNADLLVRAELYERLYRKSLRGVIVELDTNGDGIADTRRLLRMVQFARV